MKKVQFTKQLIVASMLAFRDKDYEKASEHLAEAVSQDDFEHVAAELLNKELPTETSVTEFDSLEKAALRNSMTRVSRKSVSNKEKNLAKLNGLA